MKEFMRDFMSIVRFAIVLIFLAWFVHGCARFIVWQDCDARSQVCKLP
jgi:hypothetical protein